MESTGMMKMVTGEGFPLRQGAGDDNRLGVLPAEASVDTENQSRPIPAPWRRGQSLSGGHLHHPGALHDEEGVVLPRG